jgi:DtxR family transcriptional regulator, Mn-dependent transcriptional regulator
LQDHDLVIYLPYKGATLTPEGEQRACRILRLHRLWEVLLMEKLGFEYEEAHEIACQLEHATTNDLADRLDVFLGYPPVNPLGDPIPRCDRQPPPRPAILLTELPAGQRARVLSCDVEGAPRSFLEDKGLHPGAWLQMVALAEDGVLIQVERSFVSLAQSLALAIRVEAEGEAGKTSLGLNPGQNGPPGSAPTANDRSRASQAQGHEVEAQVSGKKEGKVKQVTLDTLRVGERGVVVHVGSKGPVRRRMMDMGMVPGSEVRVRRVAPLGDPIEFEIKGYSLSLRKSEAKAIQVQISENA